MRINESALDDRNTIYDIAALRENSLSDYEIAALITLYNDFDYSVDDCIEIINEQLYQTAKYNKHDITVDSINFLVYDDYADAQSDAVESIMDYIESNYETISIGTLIDYTDQLTFKKIFEERLKDEAEDLYYSSSSDFENELVEKCYELQLISDDDFRVDTNGITDYMRCELNEDLLIDLYADEQMRGMDDYVLEYLDMFGEDEFRFAVEISNAFDALSYANDCAYELDEVANTLATYDGVERKITTLTGQYYLYRI